MRFVSFLTTALLSPFKTFLVSFFQFWGLNLGLTYATWALSYPCPAYIISKVTSSFLLIIISFLGGGWQGTGGREEVEPVRAKVAICAFNWFPGSRPRFTVEWFCCVAAGPRIFFSGGSSEIEFLIGLFLTVYENVCTPVKAVPMESRRGHWVPWGWCHRWLWAIQCVYWDPNSTLGFSGRAMIALNWWTSPWNLSFPFKVCI